jgi:hypothetical protein
MKISYKPCKYQNTDYWAGNNSPEEYLAGDSNTNVDNIINIVGTTRICNM